MLADLEDALRVLGEHGFARPEQITLLRGGNNRVYHLQGEGFSLVAKLYFSSNLDLRDRLKAEFTFSQLLWSQGSHSLAQPLFCDLEKRIGFYQALPGRKLSCEEVDEEKTQLMLDFFSNINTFRRVARHLERASEACFSLLEHAATISHRLEALEVIEEPRIHDFARQLRQLWRDIEPGLCDQRQLKAEQRCLSPSDFGLHNALWYEDKLYWLDFEYAGWDDPAKTACDAVCQPELPLPLQAWHMWLRRLEQDFGLEIMERALKLIKAYKVKWCCILLSGFGAAGRARRNYAGKTYSLDEQLNKAQKLVDDLCG